MVIPEITPQSAILGFLDSNHNNEILINHLLLIFKLYIYRSRESGAISIHNLKTKISMIRDTEKEISKSSTQKCKKFHKKWDIVNEIF